jgi:hypothetical protein
MGFFIAVAVNPNPITNTNDRQYLALDQSGFILPSHGMSVPADSPNQPARPLVAGATNPGNFTVPRFGRGGQFYHDGTGTGYIQDAAVDLVVTDWNPDNPGGYMMDAYSGLWPFGDKTPIAPTALLGAPFGFYPLATMPAPDGFGATGTTMNCLQMHSGNGKPFGLGGYPSGFGYMMSMDGVIISWGGPVTGLRSPYQDLVANGLSPNGTPGSSGNNSVRDWKVNPDNSGVHYTLFDSGYVYSGAGIDLAPIPVAPGAPQADGGSGTTPGIQNIGTARNGWKWMHVEWGEYIIIVHTTGDTWGLRLTGGTKPIPPSLTPPAQHPAWYHPVDPGTLYYPGWYRDGDIVPASSPSHFWQLSIPGAVQDDVLAGVLSISGLTVNGTNTTTTQPTISWTYNETFQVPQKNYSIRVYPQSYITSQGVFFVPGQNAGAVEVHDAPAGTTTPSHKVRRNLRNLIAFRAYVRVRSAGDAETVWTPLDFTMAIPLPTQPSSCVATVSPGNWPTSMGSVSIAAGGGNPPVGEYLQFQVSALDGPFRDVWQASASSVTPVTDPFPPTNVPLVYRVRRIKRVPGLVASAWRTASPVTVSPPGGTPSAYFFIDVGPAGAGPIVILQLEVADRAYVGAASFEAQEPRGEFQGLTQSAKLVTSGGVKGDDHSLLLKTMDTTQYNLLRKMLALTRPILYMNGFGRSWWVRPTPGTWKTLVLGAIPGETAGIRDAHDVTVKLTNSLPPR